MLPHVLGSAMAGAWASLEPQYGNGNSRKLHFPMLDSIQDECGLLPTNIERTLDLFLAVNDIGTFTPGVTGGMTLNDSLLYINHTGPILRYTQAMI